MMTKNHSANLLLDISIKQDKLVISISDEETPFYQSEEIPFNFKEIESLCAEVRLLLNKSNTSGRLSPGLLQELKKSCLLLYDRLLSARVKSRLKNAGCENLVIRMDDRLVFIPWELLFNGENFICLAFNVGRRVVTTQPLTDQIQRQPRLPLKMLVLADSSEKDLPAARKEVLRIRDELDCNREVLAVSAKTGHITVDYVTRHLRDYDFVHFAGHNDYEENQPALSGWRLSDGRFSTSEIQKMQGGSPFPLLIFLNSCQSAHISAEQVKEGYEQKCFGLVHTFLTAGVRHYIGTLWEIPDAVGLLIASEFYSSIKEGVTIGEALRQARRKAMKEFGEENIVWAGYVLYGDPKYIPFPRGLKAPAPTSSVRKLSRKVMIQILIGVLGILIIIGGALIGLREKNNSVHSEEQSLSHRNPHFNISDNRLTQLTNPSPNDSAQLASLKHRLREARKAHDPALTAQTSYDLANKYKEMLLEKMIFSSAQQNVNPSDPAVTNAYFNLLDLYHLASQYADQVQNNQLAAHAFLGTADVNRWRGEYQAAIGDYEKAIEFFAAMKTKQESDNFLLVTAYIDLTQLYALQSLNFIKAEESLNKIFILLKAIEDRNLKQVILRQYDYFLSKIARSNYSNSHFASQARTMRKNIDSQ